MISEIERVSTRIEFGRALAAAVDEREVHLAGGQLQQLAQLGNTFRLDFARAAVCQDQMGHALLALALDPELQQAGLVEFHHQVDGLGEAALAGGRVGPQ